MFTAHRPGPSHLILDHPHGGFRTYRGHRATDGIHPLIVRHTRFDSDAVRRTIAKGCDAAVSEMTGFDQLVRHLPLNAIWTTLPRAFVDVNRSKDEVSGLALEGAPLDKHHGGVIWSRSAVTGLTADEMRDSDRAAAIVKERSEPMLHAPYAPEEFRRLMRATYDRYHGALIGMQQGAVQRHGACIQLSLHSMAPHLTGKANGSNYVGPRAKRGAYDPSKGTLPDVFLIHNGFKSCDSHFVSLARGIFQKHGLIVDDGRDALLGDNGMTAMYGGKGHVHVLGIEHVTHGGEEPGRLSGSATVDVKKARRHQRAYRELVLTLLNL